MDLGLKGKSVIVTGGGSNIGRAIVLGFAKEGAKITIADIDEKQAQKVADQAKKMGAGDAAPQARGFEQLVTAACGQPKDVSSVGIDPSLGRHCAQEPGGSIGNRHEHQLL